MRAAARLSATAATVTARGLARVPGGSAWGRAAAELAWWPLRVRREVVEAQVAAAFPERGAGWVRRTSRAAYLHFGRELALTARLARAGPEAVLERVANPGALREARAAAAPDGAGCVVVTGHLGNWELAGACLAAVGAAPVAVVRRQPSPLDRELAGLRSGLGVESVPEAEAPRRLPAALVAGATVALVADQHAGARGVRLPFLGRPASTWRGPARLALRCGVPLLFGALVRDGEGYRVVVSDVGAPDGPPGADAVVGLTRRWLGRLEEEVRARPGQYFWFHRRWKPGGRPAAAAESGVGTPPPAGM